MAMRRRMQHHARHSCLRSSDDHHMCSFAESVPLLAPVTVHRQYGGIGSPLSTAYQMLKSTRALHVLACHSEGPLTAAGG
jgi:hypothetical protein